MTEIPKEFADMIEQGMEFVKRIGLKVVKLEPRYVELKVPLQGNTNHIGTMYAGALFTLAEIPGGAIFMTTFDFSQYYPIVKEMTTKFKRPVMTDAIIKVGLTDDEVEKINSDAEEHGKAEFLLKGEIFDDNGQLVAESLGTYQIRRIGT